MIDEKREQLMTQLIRQNNGSVNFTVKEVCKVLKLSRAKLSKLQRESRISFWKDNTSKNGSVRFTVHDIVDFILGNEVSAYEGVDL